MSPQHPPQDWRQPTNPCGARASPPPLSGGASPGRRNDKFISRPWPVGSKSRLRRRGSLAPRTPRGEPWGPGETWRPGSSGRGAGCCAGRAEAPGAGPAPPASLPGQRPRRRRNPVRRRRRRHCHRRLLSLPVSVAAAAPSVTSRRKGRHRGQRGAPADAPPAASRAAPPRGDEAPAVKMEVTCLLLLALIPFHCRGQGVYGKSRCPAARWLSTERKLCKRRKVRAAGVWWGPRLALWSGCRGPRPFPGARRSS